MNDEIVQNQFKTAIHFNILKHGTNSIVADIEVNIIS